MQTENLILSQKKLNQTLQSITHIIRYKIYYELSNMGKVLDLLTIDQPLYSIYTAAESYLIQIAKLLNEKAINPFVEIKSSSEDYPKAFYKKRVRIGVYPVAANPFHWGHFIIGLSAIARLKLDKVIYVPAGDDKRKPDLVPADIRHRMGCSVLKIFEPLFSYSPVAKDSCFDGETNLFRLLQHNKNQQMDIFYIAGGDHYRRVYDGTDYPDTIQKLENNILNNIYDFDEKIHNVSAVFIKRGKPKKDVATFIKTSFLPAVSFEASSTIIRNVFQGKAQRQSLAILPFTSFLYINLLNLYKSDPEQQFSFDINLNREATCAVPQISFSKTAINMSF